MNRHEHRTGLKQARGEAGTALPMKGIASAVCLAIGVIGMASSAHAQIAGDNRAGMAPAVTAAANGTPLVNINAASASGVSLNHYAQFNTDARGVILNNSSAASQTQLGGAIGGNAQMVQGPARIIVNQVIGRMPSNLVGSVEVAGRRAEVVLSNPNGITVNGAGFINTSRAMLTTGTPMHYLDGTQAVRVLQGTLVVNKLDGRGVEQVDLIARAVKINGEIHADNALNVIAGANEVNYRTANTPESLGAMRGTKPGVAIDVAALGGMYAKKIALVGTEQGVGVNIAGVVDAKESLRVDSGGNLVLPESARLQGGQIDITSWGGIKNSGVVESKDSLVAFAADSLDNSNTGVMNAGGRLALQSLVGAVSNDGTLSSKDKLSVFAGGKFTNSSSGFMQSTNDTEVNSYHIAQAGKITAGANVFMRDSSSEGLVNEGMIKADNELDLYSNGGVRNTAAGGLHGGRISVHADGGFSNEGLVEATAGNAVIFGGTNLTNAGAGVIRANNDVNLVSYEDVEQNGRVTGKRVQLISSAGGVSNAGTVQATDRIDVHTSRPLVNTGTLTGPVIVNE